MKRTVTGIVLAAVLLSPACGLAAQKHSGESAPLSWWQGLVEFAARLITTGQAKSEIVPVPVSGGDEDGDPRTDQGTTWDANG